MESAGVMVASYTSVNDGDGWDALASYKPNPPPFHFPILTWVKGGFQSRLRRILRLYLLSPLLAEFVPEFREILAR
jgi:hypothetical protein